MGSEQFLLAAPSMATIEKYLLGRFCLSIRSGSGLPRVHVPTSAQDMSGHFTIETRDFDGVKRFALVATDGSTVAIGSADRVTAKSEFTKLALYLPATIDQFEASAVDPDGEPLFERR
ncbi:hypothetical protein A5696_21425 [Mycobacterium sp. E2699]|nr:hypothetical protein A5696_21425 [Mycobacterium sp. E2699]OBI57071.1 hypothetical protein A5705_20080 [Mycobacterium sp. E787]